MRFNFNFGPLTAAVKSRLADNLDEAGAMVEGRIVDKVGIQGPPRSVPGEPPHMDTTALHGSFTRETDRAALVTRVGTEVPYALILELGSSHIEPRPYLRSTLIESADEIGAIVCRP